MRASERNCTGVLDIIDDTTEMLYVVVPTNSTLVDAGVTIESTAASSSGVACVSGAVWEQGFSTKEESNSFLPQAPSAAPGGACASGAAQSHKAEEAAMGGACARGAACLAAKRGKVNYDDTAPH